MKRLQRVSVALIVAGFLLTVIIPPVHAQTTPWFNYSAAKSYVDTLLTDYYADVQFGQSNQPNFTVDSSNFQLWHGVGYNFNVTVMRFNSTLTGVVGFAFQPIQSNLPLVSIDNTDTVQEYFQTPPLTTGGQTYTFSEATVGITAYGTAYFNIGSNFPQYGRPVIPVIWVTNSAWVLNDSSGQNAKHAADAIYQEDIHFTNETAVSLALSSLSKSTHTTSVTETIATVTSTQTTTHSSGFTFPLWAILVAIVAVILYALNIIANLITVAESRTLGNVLKLFRFRRKKSEGKNPPPKTRTEQEDRK